MCVDVLNEIAFIYIGGPATLCSRDITPQRINAAFSLDIIWTLVHASKKCITWKRATCGSTPSDEARPHSAREPNGGTHRFGERFQSPQEKSETSITTTYATNRWKNGSPELCKISCNSIASRETTKCSYLPENVVTSFIGYYYLLLLSLLTYLWFLPYHGYFLFFLSIIARFPVPCQRLQLLITMHSRCCSYSVQGEYSTVCCWVKGTFLIQTVEQIVPTL